MRLFIAIDLPKEVVATLRTLIEQLRPAAPELKWSPASNLHITTKFVGEWPEHRIEELKTALAGVRRREPVPIAVRGLGWFPNPHHPRVFWSGVHAPPSLTELAAETDESTGALGVPREDRPYSPHLTLARIKTPADLVALRQRIAALPSVEFGEFQAASQYLYLSQPGANGSVYKKLAEFPL
jgi:RNA 2',3'-cyclic 3'-phosphodiesterase